MPSILAIDDDPFILQLIKLHLRQCGCDVRCESEPGAGIRAVLDAPPDAILLDVDMPYMNGLEVLRALKGDGQSAHIPVIMLTGRTDDDTWLQATQAGANAYITKPIERAELFAALERWLPGFPGQSPAQSI